MRRGRSLLGAAMVASLLSVAAADEPCDDCVDQWEGRVEAKGRNRHEILAEAGRAYEIRLTPRQANADLLVSVDGDWPPEPVGCRSAAGAKAVDRCTFESRHAAPLYVFVLGRTHPTDYVVGVVER